MRRRLATGVAALGLDLSDRQIDNLLSYIELLRKWNRTFNLTAIRDLDQMVATHLLDSLVIGPALKGPRVLDLGCGPGLPGIPLAVAYPQLSFVLLDRNHKKIHFVNQAVAEMALANVQPRCEAVADYRPERCFDTICTRAYASLQRFAEDAARLLCAEGRLLAMKGKYPKAELDAVPEAFTIDYVTALQVPQLQAERHLVRLSCRRQGA